MAAEFREILKLAALERDHGARELRISIATIDDGSKTGHPYVALAIYERSEGVEPRQIGCAVHLRPSDLGPACEALSTARDWLNAAPHKPSAAMHPRGQQVAAAYSRTGRRPRAEA